MLRLEWNLQLKLYISQMESKSKHKFGILVSVELRIAGSERYRAITKGHYRKAVGALLIYDISNHESFTNLEYWVEQLREHGDPGM